MRLDPAPALLVVLTLAAGPALAQVQIPADKPATEEPSDKAAEKKADSGDYWRLMASPYTVHYHKDNEGEHEYVYMVGIERQRNDGWVWGGVYFSNSFGQPSGYVYVGQRYGELLSVDKLFAQWTAGLLYGYKEPFEDKVPFNHNGLSPGAVFSLGWQFTREFSVQANLLGTAAMMVQFSIDFR